MTNNNIDFKPAAFFSGRGSSSSGNQSQRCWDVTTSGPVGKVGGQISTGVKLGGTFAFVWGRWLYEIKVVIRMLFPSGKRTETQRLVWSWALCVCFNTTAQYFFNQSPISHAEEGRTNSYTVINRLGLSDIKLVMKIMNQMIMQSVLC